MYTRYTKIFLTIMLVGIFPLKGCVNTSKLKEMNSSLLKLIKDPNRYAGAIPYVAKTREQFLKKYKLLDSLNLTKEIVFIDDCDEIFKGLIIGELHFYPSGNTFFYERINEKYTVSFSDKRIAGRDKILSYIHDNNISGLLKMANEKSQSISDGGMIYVSIYSNKRVKSFVIHQFTPN